MTPSDDSPVPTPALESEPVTGPSPAPRSVDEAVFANEPIDIRDLPQLPEEGWEPLDPRYLRSRWSGDAIAAAVVLIVSLVLTIALPDDSIPRWIPGAVGAVLLALIALIAWLQLLEINRLGYLVRDHDFSFRSGVISRTVTTVPFARIQHVSIDRGPVARAFGLATLSMRTAGSGALVVPGVAQETAQRLKNQVADRAGSLADDELVETS